MERDRYAEKNRKHSWLQVEFYTSPDQRTSIMQSVASAPVTVRIRAPSVWDSGITAMRPQRESGRVRLTDSLFKVFRWPLRDRSLEMLQLEYQGDFLYYRTSDISHSKLRKSPFSFAVCGIWPCKYCGFLGFFGHLLEASVSETSAATTIQLRWMKK